ncbi:hypothetical protein B0I35DRAFT_478666 [Stachybotrys elegans]|uniref:BZIP domain-containing protein n=1 Tax=Stachybotrys elegans TaxID=80388 RepID=A0A8K0WRK2_9HYPO|nr:hypothetical protein B0I35DRAFT_478666 [Stachybotrys elegans]
MDTFDHSHGTAIDPFLGASYTDPLSSAFTAQPMANASGQLTESSEGLWDHFDYHFDLLNQHGANGLPQPLALAEPPASAFMTGQLSNFPQAHGQSFGFCNYGNTRQKNSPLASTSRPRDLYNITPVSSGRESLSPREKASPTGKLAASSPSESTTPSEYPSPSDQKPKRKARKPRRVSAAGSMVEAREEDEEQRRSRFLERNRLAASKCRQKKKELQSDLKQTKDELEAKNIELNEQFASLYKEVTEIKALLLRHSVCNDPVIDSWIGTEAKKFVANSLRQSR